MPSVLVLDDQPNILKLIANHLSAAGADVVTCREIEAAEAFLEHVRFDVVIADLNVSERGGLEGMRLIRQVTTRFPDVRVLGISGLADDRIRELGRAMGATAILEKPLNLHDLRAKALVAGTAPSSGTIRDVEPLEGAMTRVRSVLQPICVVRSGNGPASALGVEALARSPGDSALSNPMVLFEYALHKDRTFELDRRCMGAALDEAAQLHAPTLLFLNAHPRSLIHPSFRDAAIEMARQADIEPATMVFEVTEQEKIGDLARFSKALAGLRQAGFRVALDDFGSGFANFELLYELAPDYLKMTGSLSRDITSDRARQIMVSAIVTMAERLGTPLIAENVETAEELHVLRELGVPYAQGYYFARPGPAASIRASGIVFGA